MTHLRIEQNNGVIEEVSSAVIDKLYDIVHSGNLDNTSNLIGRLHTSATYQDYIDYLEDTFKVNGVKQLIIDATKKYMSFADPEVASYWANSTYGDGVGIDSTVANSVLSIPDSAFKNNTNIQTFDELGKFVNCTIIGSEAFRGCTNLTSINLSNITTLSGTYAFSGCTSLSTISLPKLTNLGSYNNFSSTGLTQINLGTDVSDANKFTTIPKNTFNTSSSLTKVTGLNKVVVIEQSAFYRCGALQEVDLSSELTTLEADVFASCSNLQCVDIINVTSITGSEQFMYDSKLVDLATSDPTQINTGAVTYTFNWTTVPDRMFQSCLLTNKSFNFPNATSIGTSAFSGTKIVSIDIPSVTTIGVQAFSTCADLTTVTNSSNVTTIDRDAFKNCTSLTTIDLSGCTTLNYNTFDGCSSLQTVDLSNITTINSYGGLNECYTFRNCSSLTIANLANATSIPFYMMFSGCTNLRAIMFPNAVNNYGRDDYRNFNNCPSLVYVQFGKVETPKKGINQYTDGMFKSNDLTVVDFGSTTEIDDYTFKNCPNIKAIVFRYSSVVTLTQAKIGTLSMSSVFGGSTNVSIFVPDALVTSYQQDQNWSVMSSAIKPISTYDLDDYVTADYHIKQST